MPKVMSWPRMFFRYATWFGVRPARSVRRVRRRRSGAAGGSRLRRRRRRPRRGDPLGAPAVVGHRLEDRELELVGADRPRRPAVQLLQQPDRALGVGLRALDPERLVAPLDLHVERRGQRPQVLVEAAREVGQTGVVGRDEGVAKDQARHCRQRGWPRHVGASLRSSGGEAGAGHPPACDLGGQPRCASLTALRCSVARLASNSLRSLRSLCSDCFGESDHEARASCVRPHALRCSAPPTHAGGCPAPASQPSGFVGEAGVHRGCWKPWSGARPGAWEAPSSAGSGVARARSACFVV